MKIQNSTRTIIFFLFGLSGVAALIYEIIWARELGLIFGTTVYAISTVLAVFFSGLALGSFLFGKLADKQRKPLLLYALVELGIGGYAIFTPWMFQLIQQFQATLGGMFSLEYSGWSVLRFGLSFGALIIPSTLIGGTLPVIIKYFTQRLSRLGNVTAKLYSVNTFGAVLGVILAGFFIVLWFGVAGAIYFAAGLNLIIGFITLFIWQREKSYLLQEEKAERESPTIQPVQRDPRLVLILTGFFLSGFAALALEVLWTRALILTIGISIYAFSIILITFLLGIALGSIIISRFVDKINVWNAFGVLEVLLGASVVVLIPIFGVLPFWYLSIIESFGWSFGGGISASFILTIFVLLAPTLLMGMTFPVVAKIVTREFKNLGFSVGRAYLFNTLGGVGGSLAAGFLFIPLLGVQNSIVLAAAFYLLVGSVVTLFSSSSTTRYKIAVIIVAVGFLIGGVTLPSWNRSILQAGVFTKAPGYLDKTSEELKADLAEWELLFYQEGISSHIAVVQERNQKILLINGKTQASSEYDKEPQLLLGHLPMLFHSNPKQALVIGLASGMTLGAVEQYPELEKVTAIEIEAEVVEAASYFADVTNDALNDPRLRVVVGDARNYLLTTDELFDVISSEPSNPWIKGMANLYTKEFFELAKQRLNKDGLMVQWMQINALSNKDLRSFIATFQSVFPEISLWETLGSVILVGSESGFGTFDIERINEHLTEESVRQDLARIEVENAPALFSYFVASNETLNELTAGFPLHTDNRPFLEFSSPRSFYQSKEQLLENLRLLNSIRVPVNTVVDVSRPETEDEIQQYFDFRTHLIKARLAYLNNNFEEAVAAYEAAKKIFPASSIFNDRLKLSYAILANQFEAQENYSKAEEYYRKLVSAFPEEALAWRDLGAFYANQKAFGKAEEAFLRSLELNPNDSESYVYLGALYRTIYRTDEALREFQEASRLNPKSFSAWNNLGYIYQEIGDIQAAINAYQKALEINPQSKKIQSILQQLRK